MDHNSSAIAQALDSLIQSDQIHYHPQWQPSPQLPEKPLILPQTEDTLAKVCSIAQQQQWSIFPCGQGSKATWGGLPSKIDVYLSTRPLNQVIDHAIGDLTITVQSGITLADLQQQLQPHNQFLPLDPAYPDRATLGGIVATADAGSWRERYGGVRDLLIGLSFVRTDGEIAKAGGRVVKNVAGYDLMKLFTGSYGTLGIITQLTFRTYPLPPASGTIAFTGDTEKIAQMAQALRNSSFTPTRADFLSVSVVKNLNLGEGCGLIIQFETIPESIAKQIEELSTIGKSLNLTMTRFEDNNEKSLWDQLKSLTSVCPNDSGITCKIGLLPSAIAHFLSQLPADHYGIIHNKSGLGKLVLTSDQDISHLKEMRNLCQDNQGFLTILEASNTVKTEIDPWGYTGNALTMMKKIKQQFDPNNQFSPNRFVGGI